MSDEALTRNERAAAMLQHICLIAQISMTIPREDIDNLVSELSRFEAVQPILNPTAFRGSMDDFTEKSNLVAAFSMFHKTVAKLIEEGKRR